MRRLYRGIIICVLCLLAAAVFAGEGTKEELLGNGGFEAPPDWNLYSNWVVWGNAQWSTQVSYKGQACMAIQDTWLKPHYGGTAQRIRVEPAHYYRVSFSYNRGQGFSARQREFEVEYFDKNNTSLETETYVVGLEGNSGIWQYSGEYESQAPAAADTMEIRFDFAETANDAALYIDDVCCCEVFPGYGLRNGGFEEAFNAHDRGNWQTTGAASRSDWNAASGRYSLLFAGRWSGKLNGRAWQRICVEPGRNYTLMFRHAHDNQFCAEDAYVSLIWLDSEGAPISSNRVALDLNQTEGVWHEQALTCVVPADAVDILLSIDFNETGESGACYIDDVVFAPLQSYYRCEGDAIVDDNGDEFIMRGIALSGWMFPEAYMWDIDGAGHLNSYSQLRRRLEVQAGSREAADLFWETYTTNYLTDADMAMLAEKGCNSVRIPFNYREISPENNPGAYLEKGLRQLDGVIEWCRQYNMKVILDMHSCPGGQSDVLSGDPEYMYYTWNDEWNGWQERGVAGLWLYDEKYYQKTGRTPESNVERTAEIWRHIAERYRNEPVVLGYELINEPILPDASWSNVLREAYIKITDAIRSVDRNHIIFVEGGDFSTSTDGLFPPWDDNMAVAVHRYWQPVDAESPEIAEYLQLREKWQVPFWLSESGENSNQWFAEMVKMLEEERIGWNWWGWKKVHSGDSIASAFCVPKTDAMSYALQAFWQDDLDSPLFLEGMMDLAEQVNSADGIEQPGYMDSLFRTTYLREAKPFTDLSIPGRINAVEYDLGGDGAAYHDTTSKIETYGAESGNFGRTFRNDGVDIFSHDGEPAYKVVGIEGGEWMRYSLRTYHPGAYDLSVCIRALTGNAAFTIFVDDIDVTGEVQVEQAEEWQVITITKALEVTSKGQSCVLRFEGTGGSPELLWMETVLSGSDFADRDSDGINDRWEHLYGGDFQPGSDADHDGFTNKEEYDTGTNPVDADSLFAPEMTMRKGCPAVLLPETSKNIEYEIFYTHELGEQAQWHSLTSGIVGNGNDITIPLTNSATMFLRAGARRVAFGRE